MNEENKNPEVVDEVAGEVVVTDGTVPMVEEWGVTPTEVAVEEDNGVAKDEA